MPSRMSGGAVTHVLALLCRVAAWLLVALTVCDAVLVGAPRSALLGVNGAVLQVPCLLQSAGSSSSRRPSAGSLMVTLPLLL